MVQLKTHIDVFYQRNNIPNPNEIKQKYVRKKSQGDIQARPFLKLLNEYESLKSKIDFNNLEKLNVQSFVLKKACKAKFKEINAEFYKEQMGVLYDSVLYPKTTSLIESIESKVNEVDLNLVFSLKAFEYNEVFDRVKEALKAHVFGVNKLNEFLKLVTGLRSKLNNLVSLDDYKSLAKKYEGNLNRISNKVNTLEARLRRNIEYKAGVWTPVETSGGNLTVE